MTAQISDCFMFRGKQYALAGMNGGGLFDPRAHGVQPRMLSTACWRGFYCTYEVTDAAIELRELHIGLSGDDLAKAERAELPGLEGHRPTKDEWSGHVYKDIAVRVPFTGGILLADEFIQELYVHMGFHPAWKYREVHELLFEEGKLLHAQDRSSAMAALREKLSQGALQPGHRASRDEIARWIEGTFSLDYGGLLPPS